MIRTIEQLFAQEDADTIVAALQASLQRRGESPFWASKVPPLVQALLSVLIPLRERQLLFDPEGKPATSLTPALFLRWCDLMCLKHLAFTLKRSNASGRLEGTRYDAENASRYATLDLTGLNAYAAGYGINLHNEFADFPVTHYNLHTGIADSIAAAL